MTADSTVAGPLQVDLDSRWRLGHRVALRPEPFGALLYSFDTRRLTFATSLELVAVIAPERDERRGDGTHPTVREVLTARGVPAQHWPRHLAALQKLADTGMVRPAEV